MTASAKSRLAPPLVVLAGVLLAFGPSLFGLGLYQDDFAYALDFGSCSGPDLWRRFLGFYWPGRNLFVLYFRGLYALGGGNPAALHALALAIGAANAWLAWALLAELSGARAAAAAAALVFALLPPGGEVRYWFTLTPQIQVPMALCLAGFLLAARAGPRPGASLAAALGCYTGAFFAYDQFFFLWPLLLAVFWTRRRERGLAALGALYGAALWSIHLWLRYGPGSARPDTIAWTGLPARALESLLTPAAALLPLPGGEPVWGWPAAAAAAAGAALLCRGLLPKACGELRTIARGGELALFGAAWHALAYLPNLLSYIGPRNHFAPALGWAALCLAAGSEIARRRPRALPWLGGWLFAFLALSTLAAWRQRDAWARSAELHAALRAELGRLPAGVDTVFVSGAPRRVGPALAFRRHHDAALHWAWSGGPPEADGDVVFAPTRRGIFYRNDLATRARTDFRWAPYERAAFIAYDPARGFRCLRDFHLRLPHEALADAPSPARPGCAEHADIGLNAALLDRWEAPAPPPAEGAPAPGLPGLRLLELGLVPRGPVLELNLRWAVASAPSVDFALVPSLRSAGGEPLFESVYPHRSAGGSVPALWPLYDDLIPPRSWKPGELRHTFLLRLPRPLPPGDAALRLEFYALRPRDGAARLGALEAPVRLEALGATR